MMKKLFAFFLFFFFASHVNAGQLVLELPFDEGAGTVVKDIAGGGVMSLPDGTTFTSGVLGLAVVTDSTHFGTLPDSSSLQMTGDMSFVGVVRRTGPATTFLQKGVHAPSGINYIFGHNGCCGLKFTYSDATFRDTYDSSGFRMSLDTWYHIAIVVSKTSSTVSFYVDGALKSTVTCNGNCNFPTNTGGVWVGNNSSGEHCECFLDEIKMFNQALTSGEVSGMYNDYFKHLVIVNSPTGVCLGIGC